MLPFSIFKVTAANNASNNVMNVYLFVSGGTSAKLDKSSSTFCLRVRLPTAYAVTVSMYKLSSTPHSLHLIKDSSI